MFLNQPGRGYQQTQGRRVDQDQGRPAGRGTPPEARAPLQEKDLAGVSEKGFPKQRGQRGVQTASRVQAKRKPLPGLFRPGGGRQKRAVGCGVAGEGGAGPGLRRGPCIPFSARAQRIHVEKGPEQVVAAKTPCAGNHRTRNQQGSARGADRRQAPPGRLDHDQISLISELEALSEPESAQVEQPIDFASVLSRASAASKISDILRDRRLVPPKEDHCGQDPATGGGRR